MRLATIFAVLLSSAVLAGCVSPRSFAPGSSIVDVLTRAGPPTDIRFDRNGDARGVGQAEVALGGHRLGSNDLDLAGTAARMEIERFVAREFDVAFIHGGSL